MTHKTSFIVFPEHCNNFKELIFGGAFMSVMDKFAQLCVRKTLFDTENGVKDGVTHKASFTFDKPAYLNDLLDLEAKIVSVGKKSLTVEVKVKRNRNRVCDDIASGEFVFITVGDVSNLSHHPLFLPYKEHGLAMVGGEVCLDV